MNISVIRHGLTEINKRGKINGQIPDDPLSQEGIEQAEKAAPLLPADITRIYTSDFLRTRQTADILNASLHAELVLDPDLREVNVGSFVGNSWKEVEAMTGKDIFNEEFKKQIYNFRPQGGESAKDVRSRVERSMRAIKENDSEKSVLVVTSGGIIRMLYWIYKHQTLDAIENLSVHTFEI